MIRAAVLYLASPDDLGAARALVVGAPVAFRAVMAAVRAGIPHVAIPVALRDSALDAAVARTPSARSAVVWLTADAPVPADAVLLVPAGTLVTAAALLSLADGAVPRVLSDSGEGAAPIATAPPSLLTPHWPALAAGAAVGHELAKSLATAPTADADATACVERLPGHPAPDRVADRLLTTLGSPIDTWFDRVFHRRLSRSLTRWAVARGVTPNAITAVSIVTGLAAASAMAVDGLGGALVALVLYALAVILDHADGEVARVTFAESQLGHWLDLCGDTLVHAALVLAMGFAAGREAGAGLLAGVVAALGVVGSAWAMKTTPSTASRVGAYFVALGNRDAYYAMLLAFVVAVSLAPGALPPLMWVVALGTHGYWIGSLVSRSAVDR